MKFTSLMLFLGLQLINGYAVSESDLFCKPWFTYSLTDAMELDEFKNISSDGLLINPTIVQGTLYLCSEPSLKSSVLLGNQPRKNMVLSYRFKKSNQEGGSVDCTIQVNENKVWKSGICISIVNSSDENKNNIKLINRKNDKVLRQRQIQRTPGIWEQAVFIFANGKVTFFLDNNLIFQIKGVSGYPGKVLFSSQNGAEFWIDDINATSSD
jgi:hypothetical protein